ncbi:MAG: thiol peroxidase [Tissierellia bacterium]|nr:thiol peroxidase [Tissierellia bacterium]
MNKRQETKFAGDPITLIGEKATVGEKAPNFTVQDKDMNPVELKDFAGKTVIISVVPSIDTKVCQIQTKTFNERAGEIEGAVVLTISCDLPFAQDRFCAAEGLDHVKVLSDHKDLSFGEQYGFVIEEMRLLNRGIVIIDKDGVIQYVEYVEENTKEPNYDKAIEEAKKLA